MPTLGLMLMLTLTLGLMPTLRLTLTLTLMLRLTLVLSLTTAGTRRADEVSARPCAAASGVAGGRRWQAPQARVFRRITCPARCPLRSASWVCVWT